MLTLIERFFFTLVVILSLFLTFKAARRILLIIQRGHGRPDWKVLRQRIFITPIKLISFQPLFRFRIIPSFFHALVGWGFLYFIIVNLADLTQAFFPNYQFLGETKIGDLYRLGADFFSVAILVGMVALIFRRFIIRPASLSTRSDVLLHPKARIGIMRDSAIVGIFVTFHVGSRFVGESFKLAQNGPDAWQPFASALSMLWLDWNSTALTIGEHVTFWVSIGLILAFLPYFLYSKHIHIFFAPINFLLKPSRKSIGELSRLDFSDESIETFGASHLEDLSWEQLVDLYACIMCYRCQQVCPAYNTGKVLSPAALEINKRYFLNYFGKSIAKGENSPQPLLNLPSHPKQFGPAPPAEHVLIYAR